METLLHILNFTALTRTCPAMAASASSGVDSEASFKIRAKAVGVDDAVLAKLHAANIRTYGALAFVSSMQPGQQDETPLISALTQALDRAPTAAEMIPLRRLWFEASTVAVADFQQRLTRKPSSEPSELPIHERVSRLQDQRARLTGVCFSSATEPSHKLTDRVFQMITDQQVTWIPWEKLTSRASEVSSAKSDLAITFDNSGHMKLSKAMTEAQCSLQGDIQVRQALSRRALAFDMSLMCSFIEMEKYHEELFAAMSREPPPGYNCISMAQVREADKQLFLRISEETRGNVALQPTGAKPVEEALNRFKDHSQIQNYLIPLPKPPTRPGPYTIPHKGDQKGDGKGEGKGAGKAKGKPGNPNKPKLELPEGCRTRDEQGRSICFAFNTQGCDRAAPGKRCKRGMHVCWKCFAPKSFPECTHSLNT